MDDENYSLDLRSLSDDYYCGYIEFNEYRSRRKTLLERIDEEFNGSQPPLTGSAQEEEASILKQAIKFFGKKNMS